LIGATWRGLGGNREVPPRELLGGAEALPEKEGGSRGKHGFTRGSEPKANDVVTINAFVTALVVVWAN
jgi:hypothetical protein